jgi:hypothetical protein
MNSWKRSVLVLLLAAMTGLFMISCNSEDDCLNTCMDWHQICAQNCNTMFPSMAGPEWIACNESCELELGICQNTCYPIYW